MVEIKLLATRPPAADAQRRHAVQVRFWEVVVSPETREVLDITRQWYSSAVAEHTIPNDEIARFMALWIGFNALYALKCDATEGDRAQVQALASWTPARDLHAANLRERSGKYRAAVLSLAERGVYDFRKRRRVEITDVADLEQVLDAVYQVRCNLFHGHKTPVHLRDRRLVQAALLIVEAVVKQLLENEQIWEGRAA